MSILVVILFEQMVIKKSIDHVSYKINLAATALWLFVVLLGLLSSTCFWVVQ